MLLLRTNRRCEAPRNRSQSLLKRHRPFVVGSQVHPRQSPHKNTPLVCTARSTPSSSFGHPNLNTANPVRCEAFIGTSLFVMEGDTSLIRQSLLFLSHLETREKARNKDLWNQQFKVLISHNKALIIYVYFNHSVPINSYFRHNILCFSITCYTPRQIRRHKL